jgi:hypothetical protein
MATAAPLMPKATAVWLLDNTALSFDQIAEFCKLHPLEVKAIADGDAAQGIKGLDPIVTGQLTREQIADAEKNPDTRLKLTEPKDSAIMRLVGTTKSTIASIRDRTHWNSANLAPMDPVTLGLASQIDLDLEVQRANKEKPAPVDTGATLLPAAETTARKEAEVAAAAESDKKPGEMDVSAVFAKLKQLGGKGDKEGE